MQLCLLLHLGNELSSLFVSFYKKNYTFCQLLVSVEYFVKTALLLTILK